MLRHMTRPAAVLLVLLCGCTLKPVFNGTSGPVPVDYQKRVGLPGVDRTRCLLTLTQSEFEVPCPKAFEVEENEAGTLVAFRSPSRAWWAARVEAGVIVIDCRPGLGEGRHANFEAVTKVPDGAFACEGVSTMNAPGQVLTDVLRQLTMKGDSAGAAELLVKLATTLEDPWAANDDREDPWTTGAFTATEEVMALVKPKLCPSLLDASTSSARWLRAARVCPATPEVAEAALARLVGAFRAWPPAVDHQPDEPALRWALTLAAHFKPAETGAVGCEALQHDARSPTASWFARAAVAAAHLDCAAAERAVGCDDLRRGGQRCAPSDLDRAVQEWLELPRWFHATRHVPDTTPVLPGDAVLSLATKRGALFAARCDYQVVEVDKPSCADTKKAGTPCACGLGNARFELPLDGGWLRVPGANCEVRADDKARKFGFSRRVP
jgi:hypothetical protein